MPSTAAPHTTLDTTAYWVVAWLDVNGNGLVDADERVLSRGVHWSPMDAVDVAETARLALVMAGYRTGRDGLRGDVRVQATPLPTDPAVLEAVIETLQRDAEPAAWARVGVSRTAA